MHTLGLIGEIGSRVLTAITADAASPDQQWRALTSRLQPLRTPKVTIIQAEAATVGSAFRLRLQSDKGARCCLITSGAEGKLEAQPLTLNKNSAESSETQILHLPEDTREVWLLYHNAVPAPKVTTGRADSRLSKFCTATAEEDDAPVHILNGVGNSVAASQGILTSLLGEIGQDPTSWRVLRLRVGGLGHPVNGKWH